MHSQRPMPSALPIARLHPVHARRREWHTRAGRVPGGRPLASALHPSCLTLPNTCPLAGEEQEVIQARKEGCWWGAWLRGDSEASVQTRDGQQEEGAAEEDAGGDDGKDVARQRDQGAGKKGKKGAGKKAAAAATKDQSGSGRKRGKRSAADAAQGADAVVAPCTEALAAAAGAVAGRSRKAGGRRGAAAKAAAAEAEEEKAPEVAEAGSEGEEEEAYVPCSQSQGGDGKSDRCVAWPSVGAWLARVYAARVRHAASWEGCARVECMLASPPHHLLLTCSRPPLAVCRSAASCV